MHIVEQLISERAQKLMSRKWLFSTIKPILYKFLDYNEAVRLADTIEPLEGRAAFQHVADTIEPKILAHGLDNLPEDGKCIVIANHPTGLADGIAVFAAINTKRPDHIYYANADALRVMPKGEDIIIPVEWVLSKRTSAKTRKTLTETRKAFAEGRCLVIFPSGKLAKLGWKGLYDHPWESSAAMLARKYEVPVIPLQIKARNSWAYYVLSKISGELRDITLFYELLNKRSQKFVLTFGKAIDPQSISSNATDAIDELRSVVEKL